MAGAEPLTEDTAREDAAKPAPGAGTKDGEALARAARAFELGRFAEVRRLCAPLRSASSPEVAEAAGALLRRVSVDPAQIIVLLGSLGLFVWIVLRYVL
jgi:hypothetical protein